MELIRITFLENQIHTLSTRSIGVMEPKKLVDDVLSDMSDNGKMDDINGAQKKTYDHYGETNESNQNNDIIKEEEKISNDHKETDGNNKNNDINKSEEKISDDHRETNLNDKKSPEPINKDACCTIF